MAEKQHGDPRKKAVEDEIRGRERWLTLLTDAMPALIAYCDRQRVYRFCNARYREWFGLSPGQVIGQPLAAVVGGAAAEQVAPYVEKVLAGEPVSFEDKLPYRHGPPREVQVNYIPDVSDDGSVVGFYAMVQDIGDRVTAERERSRLAAIIAYSHDAILGKDLDGRITDWNAAAERMYGYRADEIVGRNVDLLIPPDRKAEQREILERIMRGEATEQLETIRRRKDGATVEVLLTVSPIRDGSGAITGASSIAHDIGRRLQNERNLHRQTDRLEERVAERTAVAEKRAVDLREMARQVTNAEQRARRRLAQAIHDDLQQLLVAAKLRIPSKESRPSGAELERVTELIDQSLRRCRALVSELRPPILMDGSLDDAFDWLARHMLENHKLVVELDCEKPIVGLDEDTKLVVFEAVREMLFNVVKHAGTDRAGLRLSREAEWLSITVSDSGKGFSPDADGTIQTSKYGLFNARERIEAFGGGISIDSASGAGARFTLTMPIAPVAGGSPRGTLPLDRTDDAVSPSPASRQKSSVIRILVVDDHEIFREGLVRILEEESDLEVVEQAADGDEAVRKALSLKPDIVVMDISMPSVNGIEATREIVTRLEGTRVIGLALHDTDFLGQVILDAGASAYLEKDSASTTLIDTIRRHCHPGSE